MNGDVQVRFCERLGGQFPGPTRLADTPSGATASARLYSLVETAKANGLEPWAYLAEVFEKLPTAATDDDIEALLPWRVQLAESALRVANP